MSQSFLKDPDATLDYAIDWSDWLDGDTIADSSWTASDGITIADDPAPSHTTTVATVWLSGGTLGGMYDVTNRITTAAGRIADRTIVIRVVSQ